MHELLTEALAEPSGATRPPVPEADYSNALQQLSEAWQSALQMLRFSQARRSPPLGSASRPRALALRWLHAPLPWPAHVPRFLAARRRAPRLRRRRRRGGQQVRKRCWFGIAKPHPHPHPYTHLNPTQVRRTAGALPAAGDAGALSGEHDLGPHAARAAHAPQLLRDRLGGAAVAVRPLPRRAAAGRIHTWPPPCLRTVPHRPPWII